jgi:hypothetical protein
MTVRPPPIIFFRPVSFISNLQTTYFADTNPFKITVVQLHAVTVLIKFAETFLLAYFFQSKNSLIFFWTLLSNNLIVTFSCLFIFNHYNNKKKFAQIASNWAFFHFCLCFPLICFEKNGVRSRSYCVTRKIHNGLVCETQSLAFVNFWIEFYT